jgi:aryl-alcohol dehydrogenase-like predicted oxidoreductase
MDPKIHHEKVCISRICQIVISNLVLGTARWGSQIEELTAHKILDNFVNAGGRYIDGATNYPINGIPNDYGLANRFLTNWLSCNRGIEISVFIKVGSINNLGTPEADLSPESLERQLDALHGQFGSNLRGMGIHWDNRSEDKLLEIGETTQKLSELFRNGYRVGISGISCKKAYFELAPSLAQFWEIQVKESPINQDVRNSYLTFFPRAQYFAYGIGKDFLLDVQKKSSQTEFGKSNSEFFLGKNIYLEAIHKILNEKKCHKVIIGPRTLPQLESIIESFSPSA